MIQKYFSTKTIRKLEKKIGKNYFQTLDNRQHRTVISVERGTSGVSLTTILVFCLETMPRLWDRKEKPKQRLESGEVKVAKIFRAEYLKGRNYTAIQKSA